LSHPINRQTDREPDTHTAENITSLAKIKIRSNQCITHYVLPSIFHNVWN